MKSICVFCGSSEGIKPIYKNTAYALGKRMAEEGIQLVYGGAKIGLMGTVADAVLENGGKVIGVIPTFLKTTEVAHDHLTELIEVNSMHERKNKMAELSDGFIALPGGFGTLEELCEILTWSQLKLHNSPVGVLNLEGYYDLLDQQMQLMVREGFLRQANYDIMIEATTMEALLQKMKNYKQAAEKLFDEDKT